jgi:cytochrome c oxidase cbb3-type subunit 4
MDMDINIIREAVTVVSFIIFMGILLWAYGKGSKRGFDEAARIPFEENDEFADQARGEK